MDNKKRLDKILVEEVSVHPNGQPIGGTASGHAITALASPGGHKISPDDEKDDFKSFSRPDGYTNISPKISKGNKRTQCIDRKLSKTHVIHILCENFIPPKRKCCKNQHIFDFFENIKNSKNIGVGNDVKWCRCGMRRLEDPRRDKYSVTGILLDISADHPNKDEKMERLRTGALVEAIDKITREMKFMTSFCLRHEEMIANDQFNTKEFSALESFIEGKLPGFFDRMDENINETIQRLREFDNKIIGTKTVNIAKALKRLTEIMFTVEITDKVLKEKLTKVIALIQYVILREHYVNDNPIIGYSPERLKIVKERLEPVLQIVSTVIEGTKVNRHYNSRLDERVRRIIEILTLNPHDKLLRIKLDPILKAIILDPGKLGSIITPIEGYTKDNISLHKAYEVRDLILAAILGGVPGENYDKSIAIIADSHWLYPERIKLSNLYKIFKKTSRLGRDIITHSTVIIGLTKEVKEGLLRLKNNLPDSLGYVKRPTFLLEEDINNNIFVKRLEESQEFKKAKFMALESKNIKDCDDILLLQDSSNSEKIVLLVKWMKTSLFTRYYVGELLWMVKETYRGLCNLKRFLKDEKYYRMRETLCEITTDEVNDIQVRLIMKDGEILVSVDSDTLLAVRSGTATVIDSELPENAIADSTVLNPQRLRLKRTSCGRGVFIINAITGEIIAKDEFTLDSLEIGNLLLEYTNKHIIEDNEEKDSESKELEDSQAVKMKVLLGEGIPIRRDMMKTEYKCRKLLEKLEEYFSDPRVIYELGLIPKNVSRFTKSLSTKMIKMLKIVKIVTMDNYICYSKNKIMTLENVIEMVDKIKEGLSNRHIFDTADSIRIVDAILQRDKLMIWEFMKELEMTDDIIIKSQIKEMKYAWLKEIRSHNEFYKLFNVHSPSTVEEFDIKSKIMKESSSIRKRIQNIRMNRINAGALIHPSSATHLRNTKSIITLLLRWQLSIKRCGIQRDDILLILKLQQIKDIGWDLKPKELRDINEKLILLYTKVKLDLTKQLSIILGIVRDDNTMELMIPTLLSEMHSYNAVIDWLRKEIDILRHDIKLYDELRCIFNTHDFVVKNCKLTQKYFTLLEFKKLNIMIGPKLGNKGMKNGAKRNKRTINMKRTEELRVKQMKVIMEQLKQDIKERYDLEGNMAELDQSLITVCGKIHTNYGNMDECISQKIRKLAKESLPFVKTMARQLVNRVMLNIAKLDLSSEVKREAIKLKHYKELVDDLIEVISQRLDLLVGQPIELIQLVILIIRIQQLCRMELAEKEMATKLSSGELHQQLDDNLKVINIDGKENVIYDGGATESLYNSNSDSLRGVKLRDKRLGNIKNMNRNMIICKDTNGEKIVFDRQSVIGIRLKDKKKTNCTKVVQITGYNDTTNKLEEHDIDVLINTHHLGLLLGDIIRVQYLKTRQSTNDPEQKEDQKSSSKQQDIMELLRYLYQRSEEAVKPGQSFSKGTKKIGLHNILEELRDLTPKSLQIGSIKQLFYTHIINYIRYSVNALQRVNGYKQLSDKLLLGDRWFRTVIDTCGRTNIIYNKNIFEYFGGDKYSRKRKINVTGMKNLITVEGYVTVTTVTKQGKLHELGFYYINDETRSYDEVISIGVQSMKELGYDNIMPNTRKLACTSNVYKLLIEGDHYTNPLKLAKDITQLSDMSLVSGLPVFKSPFTQQLGGEIIRSKLFANQRLINALNSFKRREILRKVSDVWYMNDKAKQYDEAWFMNNDAKGYDDYKEYNDYGRISMQSSGQRYSTRENDRSYGSNERKYDDRQPYDNNRRYDSNSNYDNRGWNRNIPPPRRDGYHGNYNDNNFYSDGDYYSNYYYDNQSYYDDYDYNYNSNRRNIPPLPPNGRGYPQNYPGYNNYNYYDSNYDRSPNNYHKRYYDNENRNERNQISPNNNRNEKHIREQPRKDSRDMRHSYNNKRGRSKSRSNKSRDHSHSVRTSSRKSRKPKNKTDEKDDICNRSESGDSESSGHRTITSNNSEERERSKSPVRVKGDNSNRIKVQQLGNKQQTDDVRQLDEINDNIDERDNLESKDNKEIRDTTVNHQNMKRKTYLKRIGDDPRGPYVLNDELKQIEIDQKVPYSQAHKGGEVEDQIIRQLYADEWQRYNVRIGTGENLLLNSAKKNSEKSIFGNIPMKHLDQIVFGLNNELTEILHDIGTFFIPKSRQRPILGPRVLGPRWWLLVRLIVKVLAIQKVIRGLHPESLRWQGTIDMEVIIRAIMKARGRLNKLADYNAQYGDTIHMMAIISNRISICDIHCKMDPSHWWKLEWPVYLSILQGIHQRIDSNSGDKYLQTPNQKNAKKSIIQQRLKEAIVQPNEIQYMLLTSLEPQQEFTVRKKRKSRIIIFDEELETLKLMVCVEEVRAMKSRNKNIDNLFPLTSLQVYLMLMKDRQLPISSLNNKSAKEYHETYQPYHQFKGLNFDEKGIISSETYEMFTQSKVKMTKEKIGLIDKKVRTDRYDVSPPQNTFTKKIMYSLGEHNYFQKSEVGIELWEYLSEVNKRWYRDGSHHLSDDNNKYENNPNKLFHPFKEMNRIVKLARSLSDKDKIGDYMKIRSKEKGAKKNESASKAQQKKKDPYMDSLKEAYGYNQNTDNHTELSVDSDSKSEEKQEEEPQVIKRLGRKKIHGEPKSMGHSKIYLRNDMYGITVVYDPNNTIGKDSFSEIKVRLSMKSLRQQANDMLQKLELDKNNYGHILRMIRNISTKIAGILGVVKRPCDGNRICHTCGDSHGKEVHCDEELQRCIICRDNTAIKMLQHHCMESCQVYKNIMVLSQRGCHDALLNNQVIPNKIGVNHSTQVQCYTLRIVLTELVTRYNMIFGKIINQEIWANTYGLTMLAPLTSQTKMGYQIFVDQLLDKSDEYLVSMITRGSCLTPSVQLLRLKYLLYYREKLEGVVVISPTISREIHRRRGSQRDSVTEPIILNDIKELGWLISPTSNRTIKVENRNKDEVLSSNIDDGYKFGLKEETVKKDDDADGKEEELTNDNNHESDSESQEELSNSSKSVTPLTADEYYKSHIFVTKDGYLNNNSDKEFIKSIKEFYDTCKDWMTKENGHKEFKNLMKKDNAGRGYKVQYEAKISAICSGMNERKEQNLGPLGWVGVSPVCNNKATEDEMAKYLECFEKGKNPVTDCIDEDDTNIKMHYGNIAKMVTSIREKIADYKAMRSNGDQRKNIIRKILKGSHRIIIYSSEDYVKKAFISNGPGCNLLARLVEYNDETPEDEYDNLMPPGVYKKRTVVKQTN